MAIRELSKKISNKPSREELDNYIKFKPNNDEEIFQSLNNLRNCLDQKMNKSELSYYLNQKNNTQDCININQFNDLLNQFELFKNDIYNKLNKFENEVVIKDDKKCY